jgi:hypothetical protein
MIAVSYHSAKRPVGCGKRVSIPQQGRTKEDEFQFLSEANLITGTSRDVRFLRSFISTAFVAMRVSQEVQ